VCKSAVKVTGNGKVTRVKGGTLGERVLSNHGKHGRYRRGAYLGNEKRVMPSASIRKTE